MTDEQIKSAALRSGAHTSEHGAAKSSGLWGLVTLALGTIGAGGEVFTSETPDPVVVIAFAAVAAVGIAVKGWVDVSYIKARSTLKGEAVRP